MLYSIITGIGVAVQTTQSYSSEAEQAGATIGSGLGIMLLLFIWGIGDLILGLFVFLTRAK
ncbi:hypothetical protein [Aureispira sp. CCB-E]|uniref:hypothetical protein n=1 Tax=Aureispira sp. CCB-E TaxID=3051121 RepID=UPI002868CEBC|nr:hypothetical protein [Aureispira sp. CCB-E]WMX17553.1 hypothetical protein QP953_28455 [Aureispira sp. CCB-E]